MSSPLFRPEAMDHHKDRLYGEVILIQPFALTVLVAIIGLILAIILGMLFWGSYARKETVQGFLVPDKGIVKVYPTQVGVVSKLFVKEGDEVKVGQPLLTLLLQRTLEGGEDVDEVLLQEIQENIKKQRTRIIEEREFTEQEKNRLFNQYENLKSNLKQTEANIATQNERVAILEKRVEGAKKLYDKKTISELEYNKYVDDMLMAQQQYQDLLGKKVQIANSMTQTQTELSQLPNKLSSRVKDLENVVSELTQRQAEVLGKRSIEIHSSVNGRVTAIQAKEGQTLPGQTPLLSIIPEGAKLQAQIYVPSRAIGFIAPGQMVRIRYDAFPHQRFGIYEGTVAEISKNILSPQELPGPVPSELKVPVYIVKVDLDRQQINAYGKAFPLQAGMAVEADIILDRQTIFQRIFDPILILRGRL